MIWVGHFIRLDTFEYEIENLQLGTELRSEQTRGDTESVASVEPDPEEPQLNERS